MTSNQAAFIGQNLKDDFRQRILLGQLSPQGELMMWQDSSIGATLPGDRLAGAAAADGTPPAPPVVSGTDETAMFTGVNAQVPGALRDVLEKARALRPWSGWEVDGPDGKPIYRGLDLELAEEIYHAAPAGAHLLPAASPVRAALTQTAAAPAPGFENNTATAAAGAHWQPRLGQQAEVSTAPGAWRPATVVSIRQGRVIVQIPACGHAPAIEGFIVPHPDNIRLAP